MNAEQLITKYGFSLVKVNGADAIKPASVPMSKKAEFERNFEADRAEIVAQKEEIKQILRDRASKLEAQKKEARRIASLDIDDQEFWDRRSEELDALPKETPKVDLQKKLGMTDAEYWEYINRL